MTDVQDAMARQSHPFVNGERLARMNGQLIAIVGKVERVEAGVMTIKTTDGKSLFALKRFETKMKSSLFSNLLSLPVSKYLTSCVGS